MDDQCAREADPLLPLPPQRLVHRQQRRRNRFQRRLAGHQLYNPPGKPTWRGGAELQAEPAQDAT